jgi:BNR repeat-like domain
MKANANTRSMRRGTRILLSFVASVCLLLSGLLIATAATPAPVADVNVIANPDAAFGDAQRLWQGIPSIERTRGGRLVVAWYSGGPGEGSIENYCLVAISDDQNHSWSPPVLVVQGREGVRTGEPLPWLDPKGRLWLFWNEIHPDKARRGTWAIRCDSPDTPVSRWRWTEPQFIGGGIVLGKPLITRTGEWLLPLDVRNDSPLAGQIGKNMAGVMVSTDEGTGWSWRGGWQLANDVNDFDEHCIVERADGSLWTVIRVKDGLLQSDSTDAGKFWSVPSPFLTGTRSRAHLRRLNSGRLLLIYHDGPAHPGKTGASFRREMLTAFLSDDQGKSWRKKLLLDPRNRVSYPDATQGPDGRIYITYDYCRYNTGCKEILALSLTEDDILANRPLPTPTLVNRATGYGNVQETGTGEEDKMREKANKKLLEGSAKPAEARETHRAVNDGAERRR